MSALNLLTAYPVVEINLSTALRTGHMLAQHKYSTNAPVANGVMFQMDKANADSLVLAGNGVGPVYLHYTEELITHGISNSLKYFAVEPEDGVCYPRCLALYAGDTFTTDNYSGSADTAKFAYIANGKLTLSATYPGDITSNTPKAPYFQAVKSTLPDGSAAMQFTVIDPTGVGNAA